MPTRNATIDDLCTLGQPYASRADVETIRAAMAKWKGDATGVYVLPVGLNSVYEDAMRQANENVERAILGNDALPFRSGSWLDSAAQPGTRAWYMAEVVKDLGCRPDEVTVTDAEIGTVRIVVPARVTNEDARGTERHLRRIGPAMIRVVVARGRDRAHEVRRARTICHLAEDARSFPAFAVARRTGLLAAIEAYPKAEEYARSILAWLLNYEGERGGMRKPRATAYDTGDASAPYISVAVERYERARGAK